MLRLTLAAGVACAVVLTHPAGAQYNASNGGGSTMPGQVVGGYRGQVNPVGQRLPAAAPPAGQSITDGAMQRPYDPNRPYDVFKGTNIDPANVLAPVVGPDGRSVVPPDALDKLSDKIRALWGRAMPALPRPPYTPGITRRAHERARARADQMWRRD